MSFVWASTRFANTRAGCETAASTPGKAVSAASARIAAGKIVETWTDWDRIAVLRELGIPSE